MATPKTLSAAIQDILDEPDVGQRLINLDRFLFTYEYARGLPLSPQGRLFYRERAKRRFLWIEWPRGAGKTYCNARVNLCLKVLSPLTILYTGPSYRQAKIPARWELKLINKGGPYLRDEVTVAVSSSERTEITFRNGAQSLALPSSGSKIHGERADDVIFTEFFDYPEDLATETVMPMLAAGSPDAVGRIVFETAAGSRASYAYKFRTNFLTEYEAGNPDYGFIHVDIEDLKRVGYKGLRYDYIEQSRRFMESAVYEQMYMTEWRSVIGSFYPWDLVHAERLKKSAILPAVKTGKLYAAGLDLGWSDSADSSESVFAVWEVTPEIGTPLALVYVEVLPRWGLHERGIARRTERVAELLRRYDIARLVIDTQGAGAAILEKLTESGFAEIGDEHPGRHILFRFPHTSPVISEMHSLFKAGLESGDVLFPARPEDDSLSGPYAAVDRGKDQLVDLVHRELPSGYYHFEPPAHHRSDIAMAMLYGHYGARMLMPQPSAPKIDRGSPVVSASEFVKVFSPSVDPRYDALVT